MSDFPKVASKSLKGWATGKVAVVTGAASGIGLALAKLLITSGAKVAMADLDKAHLQDAATDLPEGKYLLVKCDVALWKDQLNLFEAVKSTWGVPDLVCLNAGVDPELHQGRLPFNASPVQKVAADYLTNAYDFRESCDESSQLRHPLDLTKPPDLVLDVNTKGVIYGMKMALHNMNMQRTGGRIVVTGSAAAYVPFAMQDIYVSSKHAALGLVRSTSLRPELKQKDIAIAMVAPWLTLTPMVGHIAHPNSEKDSEASTAADVAWAIASIAVADWERVNGKCVWVRGSRYTEVETSYTEWLRCMGI